MLSWHQWLDSDTADWGVVNSTKFGRHWISCLIEDIHEIKKCACIKLLLRRFLLWRSMKDTKNWQNWYGRCVRSSACINVYILNFLQEIMKKIYTWNIRRLVDNSVVPSAQRTSILYCRLSDFRTTNWHAQAAGLGRLCCALSQTHITKQIS